MRVKHEMKRMKLMVRLLNDDPLLSEISEKQALHCSESFIDNSGVRLYYRCRLSVVSREEWLKSLRRNNRVAWGVFLNVQIPIFE